MKKLLVFAAIMLVVVVCAGVVDAKEIHMCDFCDKVMSDCSNRYIDYEYMVLTAGKSYPSPEFCSKRCLVAHFSGYRPDDDYILRYDDFLVGVAPICQCWWCRFIRWW